MFEELAMVSLKLKTNHFLYLNIDFLGVLLQTATKATFFRFAIKL